LLGGVATISTMLAGNPALRREVPLAVERMRVEGRACWVPHATRSAVKSAHGLRLLQPSWNSAQSIPSALPASCQCMPGKAFSGRARSGLAVDSTCTSRIIATSSRRCSLCPEFLSFAVFRELFSEIPFTFLSFRKFLSPLRTASPHKKRLESVE